MKRAIVILMFGLFGTCTEVIAAECSSYYISEITIVPADDTEAGRVHTYVGFGETREESEQKAMQACSHLRFDLQYCLESDRRSGRNTPSVSADDSLHLKYTKAVKRITGCS